MRTASDNREWPLVTVLTLIYNTGHYVLEALESVKQQNYPNIQHILIDDCSSDSSVEIISNWIRENNYDCEFIVHPKNLGISKSLNDGLRRAKGKYFTGVCDDLFLPGKLHRQVEMLESLGEEYGMVYSDIRLRNDDGEDLGSLLQKTRGFVSGPEGDLFEELYLGNFIHGTATLMRMKCFETVGYYNESLAVEDIELYLRIAQKFKFKFDSEVSAIYRIHSKTFMATIGLRGLEENLKSLEPYRNYSNRTAAYFFSYLDSCLEHFHAGNYANWKHWHKKRWAYKKDPRSALHYVEAVLNIKYSNSQKVKSLLGSPKRILKKAAGVLRSSEPNEGDEYRKMSYSQCGEDILIEYIFKLRGVTNPTYIDIGANHPYYLSNTAKFYAQGCRGINIEANPELAKLFEKHRPNDVNLNIGISHEDNELEFYIMEDNTLSTFSSEERDAMVANGKKLVATKKVRLTTISKVLDQHFGGQFPDFMSLDVEGLDFQILQSIDFQKSSPKIICVEAAEYSPIGAGARRNDLINFLVDKGYYEYANTNLNAIMVKRDFWFK